MAGNHTHSVMRIHYDGGGCFFYDFNIGNGQKSALFDTIDVDGFEAVAAVAFDASSVRFEQYVSADCGVLSRYSVAHKSVS